MTASMRSGALRCFAEKANLLCSAEDLSAVQHFSNEITVE
jgi:hypothetical protein